MDMDIANIIMTGNFIIFCLRKNVIRFDHRTYNFDPACLIISNNKSDKMRSYICLIECRYRYIHIVLVYCVQTTV